jgi:hypothetical protein
VTSLDTFLRLAIPSDFSWSEARQAGQGAPTVVHLIASGEFAQAFESFTAQLRAAMPV